MNRTKETLDKVLKEDITLRKRLKTLFKEQGITIVRIQTAIGMIIGVIIEAVIPTTGGTGTPPKPPSKEGVKVWDKKQLHNLARLLANLAGKAALSGVIDSIVSKLKTGLEIICVLLLCLLLGCYLRQLKNGLINLVNKSNWSYNGAPDNQWCFVLFCFHVSQRQSLASQWLFQMGQISFVYFCLSDFTLLGNNWCVSGATVLGINDIWCVSGVIVEPLVSLILRNCSVLFSYIFLTVFEWVSLLASQVPQLSFTLYSPRDVRFKRFSWTCWCRVSCRSYWFVWVNVPLTSPL